MKTRKGDKIVCSCGVEAGSVLSDVQDGRPITSNDFGSDGDISDDGYCCSTCGEPVAIKSPEGKLRIRSLRGWVEEAAKDRSPMVTL